jgi:hypothetical protein
MKHGAKLVVMDTVLPEPNTVGQSQERLQRYVVLGIDVKQKQANLEQHPRSSDNGFFHEGERKGNWWLEKDFQRLKIRRVVTPPESATSLVKLAINGNDYAVKARIMIFRSSIASSSKQR